jgi:hypothetical protein
MKHIISKLNFGHSVQRWKVLLLGAVILSGIIVTAMVTMQWYRSEQLPEYSAIFLTNDQVYFGRLADEDENFLTLTSVYYLKASASINPESTNLTTEENSNITLALVKLGNELHGPKDKMLINRDHILFIEELRPDGRVIAALKEYEAKAKK